MHRQKEHIDQHAGRPLVSLSNAGLRRDGRWLVRGVDLSIRRGEVVTLIGPNGAGKSTTARLAIGVLRADEGSVHRAPGLRIGYVPQKLSIDWTMPLSVRRLMRLTSPLKDSEILAALEATGIPHLVDAEVRHLSGGEFQRALLARAIARKPDLMVLDEPVQGVDFAGEAAIYAPMDAGFPADGIVAQTRGEQVWALAELDFAAFEASRAQAQVANDRDWRGQLAPAIVRAEVEDLQ